MSEPIVVIITCGTYDESEEIASRLIEEKLAACVKIAGRVRSLFEWKATVSRETEFMLMVVSEREQFDALAERVKQLHSYEVPEIVGLPVVLGSEDYLDWISENVGGDPQQ
jgi:periplasmic divalent cation tolerance protein